MTYSIKNLNTTDSTPGFASTSRAYVKPRCLLPTGSPVALAGDAGDQLRAFLRARGMGDWDIYGYNTPDLADVDQHLASLGEADARWQPHAAVRNGGELPAFLAHDAADRPECHPAGFLWLRRHQVVVARWTYYDVRHHAWLTFQLFAAPTPEHPMRLRLDLADILRRASRGKWQVYGPQGWHDADEARTAGDGWDGLVLDADVRRRLESEIAGFFRPPVAALYRELGIPYRRGLLLYGPPGNGKTSLVRVIGGLNPDVPGLLLRPGEDFDDSELSAVIDHWRRQAPAVLVIEDLDWLFRASRLNVSTFLNTLDGVDRRDGGLLLVATTNHPDALDPAINNRPGRFDVAIEIASPDRARRREFFRRSRLALADGDVLDRLSAATDGLSFAHLREIESLSGLYALQAGRATRTDEDVFRAAETVRSGSDRARRGFPEPAQPFGLAQLRGRREG